MKKDSLAKSCKGFCTFAVRLLIWWRRDQNPQGFLLPWNQSTLSKAWLSMVRKVEVDFSQVWAHFFLPTSFSFQLAWNAVIRHRVARLSLAQLCRISFLRCTLQVPSLWHSVWNVCNSVISGSFVLLSAPSSYACESVCLSFSEIERSIKVSQLKKTPN